MDMIKYIKLVILKISFVTFISCLIWIITNFRSGNGFHFGIFTIIIILFFLIIFLIKEVWSLYNKIEK